jgi:hypothetical protein
MLIRSLLLRQRACRWSRTLKRWGPERCTIATAATIVGTDAQSLAQAVEAGLHRSMTSETLLSKDEILVALRPPAAQCRHRAAPSHRG